MGKDEPMSTPFTGRSFRERARLAKLARSEEIVSDPADAEVVKEWISYNLEPPPRAKVSFAAGLLLVIVGMPLLGIALNLDSWLATSIGTFVGWFSVHLWNRKRLQNTARANGWNIGRP